MKDKEIDELMGEGLPQQIMNKFKIHRFHKNILFVRIKRDTPIKSFTVYEGFSHWCSCGWIDMSKDYFISHVKRQHQGIIPQDSQLNRSFWYDWVKFKSDEIEELYCYSLSDLSEVIL